MRIILLVALALSGVKGPAAAYDAAAGRRLYLQHCAMCHGPEGRGDGPAAVRLDPRPRNLSSGLFKVRSTPSGNLASVEDFVRTLTRGLPGSSMPSFADILSPGEMGDAAGYVLSLPPAKDLRRATTVSIGLPVPASRESLARGSALYRRLRCAECHGENGSGDGRPAAILAGEFARPAHPADLAAPWTFKGGGEAKDIVMRLTAGLDATPMPSFQDQTTLADRWDLARYIASLRRTPDWQLDAAGLTRRQAERFPTLEARGRYLARSLTCGLCHTPTSKTDGAYREDRELQGGVKIVAYPFAAYYSPNLTPHPDAGIGNWKQEEIVRALKTGMRPDRSRIAFNGMPWAFFAVLPDEDLDALAAYLKTLPPVANRMPPAKPFMYLENIGYKLAHAVLGRPATFELWPGSDPFAYTDVPGSRRRMAYYCFFGGVLLLLIASAFLLQVALTRRKRWQQAVALAAAAGVIFLGAGGCAALYLLPPLDLMAPEKVVESVTGGLPIPDPADPTLMPIAMRGRTLVNANCAMCHTPAPMLTPRDPRLNLAGGSKTTSPFFGVRYTRNLTPDLETGLGAWSLPDILRAVRSGVARDGRHIHWLDMPWDRFSNFDEGDLTAIGVYLKTIPPVKHRVPPPEPSSPGDPPALSVYFGDSGKLLE